MVIFFSLTWLIYKNKQINTVFLCFAYSKSNLNALNEVFFRNAQNPRGILWTFSFLIWSISEVKKGRETPQSSESATMSARVCRFFFFFFSAHTLHVIWHHGPHSILRYCNPPVAWATLQRQHRNAYLVSTSRNRRKESPHTQDVLLCAFLN